MMELLDLIVVPVGILSTFVASFLYWRTRAIAAENKAETYQDRLWLAENKLVWILTKQDRLLSKFDGWHAMTQTCATCGMPVEECLLRRRHRLPKAPLPGTLVEGPFR